MTRPTLAVDETGSLHTGTAGAAALTGLERYVPGFRHRGISPTLSELSDLSELSVLPQVRPSHSGRPEDQHRWTGATKVDIEEGTVGAQGPGAGKYRLPVWTRPVDWTTSSAARKREREEVKERPASEQLEERQRLEEGELAAKDARVILRRSVRESRPRTIVDYGAEEGGVLARPQSRDIKPKIRTASGGRLLTKKPDASGKKGKSGSQTKPEGDDWTLKPVRRISGISRTEIKQEPDGSVSHAPKKPRTDKFKWTSRAAKPSLIQALNLDRVPSDQRPKPESAPQPVRKSVQDGRTSGARSTVDPRPGLRGSSKPVAGSGSADALKNKLVADRRSLKLRLGSGNTSKERQPSRQVGDRPNTTQPVRPVGYPSSRFAKVLRLVAGLPPVGPLLSSTMAPIQSSKERGKGKPPARRPPVWAESRQELCEALPYYRAFQSGLYMFGRLAMGYLLEAFGAPRDVWAQDGRIVISHGGGQCVRTTDQYGARGDPVLAADQSSTDARVDALLQAYQNHTPIVLIAGEGYPDLPWKLDCAYVVLGWYWISAVWVEAEPVAKGVVPPEDRDYFHRYKIRFDWVQSQGRPWWIDVPADELPPRPSPQDTSPETSTSTLEDTANGLTEGSPLAHMELDTGSSPALDHFPSSAEQCATGAATLRDRLSVANLCSPPARIQDTRKSGGEVLDTPISATKAAVDGVEERRASTAAANFDPLTGMTTPPITPPQASKASVLPCVPTVLKTVTTSASEGSKQLDHEGLESDLESESEVESIYPDQLDGHDLLEDLTATSNGRDVSRRALPGSKMLRCSSPLAVSPNSTLHAFAHISDPCPSCKSPSPRIYIEGWICLRPTCRQFWLLSTTTGLMPIPPGLKLSYIPSFLESVPTPGGLEKMAYELVPAMSSVGATEPGFGGLTRGWVCGSCGRANCRYRWEAWECASCKRTLFALSKAHTTSTSSLQPLYPSYLGDGVVHPQSGIRVEITTTRSTSLGPTPTSDFRSSATVMIYILPRDAGKVYHVIPRDRSQSDALWREYQVEAARSEGEGSLFERKALRCATVKGALLAQHFAVNSGATYKYNVATSSLSFDESPPCVMRALDLIKSHASQVLDEEVWFNEILSVMYRDGQKMSWHDDGEEGLGPVVASLSLGSPASMSWRPKARRVEPNIPYYQGHEAAKVPKRPKPIPVLSLTLSHGDMIIMQGSKLQERYSHRVIPHGYRVAATARTIKSTERPTVAYVHT